MVEQWNSVEQYGRTVEQCGGAVEQYGGTVEHCGGTVRKRMVEQGTVCWKSVTWNSVVEHCGTAWRNSSSVAKLRWKSLQQYGERVEQCGRTVWNGMVEQWQNSGTVWLNGGTVWWNRGTVRWDSVEKHGGTVWWNSVEQWNSVA